MKQLGLFLLATSMIATAIIAQTPRQPSGSTSDIGRQPSRGDGERQARGQPNDPRDQTPLASFDWYKGGHSVESIDAIAIIDDPVTGFGNESLWERAVQGAGGDQSDVAVGETPD